MLIIAHRGASGDLPENTRAAFKKAVEMRVDMISCDVRRCKSGEIVVINDTKVDRTTNGRGSIKSKPLIEIKVLNAGQGEKIPTLQEALDSIGKNVKININIKEKAAIEPTVQIILDYIIKKNWKPESFLLSSTKFFKLQKMKEIYSFLTISPVIVFFPKFFARTLISSRPFSLHVDKKFISKSFVDYVHKQKMKVYVWTVNDRSTLEIMKELGVDGVITDYPDKIKQLLRNLS